MMIRLTRSAPSVRGLLLAAFGFLSLSLSTSALAQQVCAKDLNGNGNATDPGEGAACTKVGALWQCPIERVACTGGPGNWTCPSGPAPCLGSGTPMCSRNACFDPKGSSVPVVPPMDDPGAPPDGTVNAAGQCTAKIEIFGGTAKRCRPAGALDSFQDCCADKGKIIEDGGGSSITSISSKIAVAGYVFKGMKAAVTAYRAGATASAAASAGFKAMIVGIDPTSIAASIAISFVIETLLKGCDQQDGETGMMKGSGMCHYVGEYCDASLPIIGCIQPAHSYCCFNSKLGRIIQEQGRPQLASFNGIGWGPVKKPICRGLTPEEFQALDFSKMDLSEYYADVEKKAQATIQTDMQGRLDEYMRNVAH